MCILSPFRVRANLYLVPVVHSYWNWLDYCACGAFCKWSPRTTPCSETTSLSWIKSIESPVCFANTSFWKLSTNCPRDSSGHCSCWGVLRRDLAVQKYRCQFGWISGLSGGSRCFNRVPRVVLIITIAHKSAAGALYRPLKGVWGIYCAGRGYLRYLLHL